MKTEIRVFVTVKDTGERFECEHFEPYGAKTFKRGIGCPIVKRPCTNPNFDKLMPCQYFPFEVLNRIQGIMHEHGAWSPICYPTPRMKFILEKEMKQNG